MTSGYTGTINRCGSCASSVTGRPRASRSGKCCATLRLRSRCTPSHALPTICEEFERNAIANGIQVHWARDGAEHNAIVHRILSDRGITRLVKSKSMLTEECHLNPYLEVRGIEVTDTDLGERIVQLRHEPPSHIVLPAIHLKKEDIGKLFHEKLGTTKGASDPKYLTEAARGHLREKFMAAQAGLTGVNFAIAETGGFVVCTNEGNADMGTSLPPHPHRLHGRRKDPAPGKRSRRVSPAPRSQCDRAASDHL